MSAKAKQKSRRTRFQESVYLSESNGRPQIDRQAGVIRNVKILGRDSKNENGKREYSDDALREALPLYEGAGVNFDHPAAHEARRDRHFHEAAGQIRNVHLRDGEPYGDLHVLTSHPHASMLFEAAERMPDRFGLSHNADGDIVRTPDGRSVIKKITRVRSVDIVHKPATNQSLFESVTQRGTPMKKVKLSALLESQPEMMESLSKKFEEGYRETKEAAPDADAGAGGPDDMASADVEVPDSDGDGDDHTMILALLQFVMKILGKSQATQERMRESMKGMGKVMESKFGPDVLQGFVPDQPAGAYARSGDSRDGGAKGTGQVAQKDMPYQESVKLIVNSAVTPLLEAVTELKKEINNGKADKAAERDRAECVTLIESQNREADDVIVGAVLSAKGREDRLKLIARFPEKSRVSSFAQRPTTSVPALLESEAPALATPKTRDDFVRSISGRPRSRAS